MNSEKLFNYFILERMFSMDNKEVMVEKKPEKSGNATGIVSLVISGIAFLGSWIPIVNIISMILAVAGIIVGAVSLIMVLIKKAGMIIFPILGIVFGILTFALGTSVYSIFSSGTSSSTSSSQSSSTSSAQNSNSSSSNSTQKSSSGSSSKQNENKEYKVGDVISWAGREITVTNVDKKYVPEYSKAKSGKEFIKVTINVVNKSSSDISVSPSYFKVKDSTGAKEGHESCTYSLSDTFESATLSPGGSRKGSLVFEVNEDDNNLKLICSTSSLSSSNELEIKL